VIRPVGEKTQKPTQPKRVWADPTRVGFVPVEADPTTGILEPIEMLLVGFQESHETRLTGAHWSFVFVAAARRA
jgi:hypothetical protein